MEPWRTRFWIVFVCFLVSLAMNMGYAQSLRTTNDALREDGAALRRANQALESAETLLGRCRDAMRAR